MKQLLYLTLFGLILLQTSFIACEDENLLLNVILIIRPKSVSPSFPSLTLVDRPSLRHKLENWSEISSELVGKVVSNATPLENDIQFKNEMCKDAPNQVNRLTQSVTRAVNYYEAHIDQLKTLDASVGLQVLQGALQNIFKKRGDNLQISLINRTIPLINQIVEQSFNGVNGKLGSKALAAFSKERNLFTRFFPDWKSPQVLHQKSLTIENVGHDLETVWGPLNAECLGHLVRECNVPYTCRRTYLDPEPQSQYMLTHQTIYLLFAAQKSCDSKHPEVFQGWENNLESQCGKMLKEAELLAMHGFPDWGRDLFSEYVFLCGLSGFPNFLRSDWIQEIESWQSKSDLGCFVNSGDKKYLTTEVSFPRKSTAEERLQNVEPTEECATHFSSTSLSALAVKLEWLHDNCFPFGEEH